MPTVTDVFTRKNADADLADALAYRRLNADEALFVHTHDGWKVASHNKADTLRAQGWTLCIDGLTSLFGHSETSDDGKEEAAIAKKWMMEQK